MGVVLRQEYLERNYVVAAEHLGVVLVWRVEFRRAEVFQRQGVPGADPRFGYHCDGAVHCLDCDASASQGFNQGDWHFSLDIHAITFEKIVGF